MSFYTLLVIVCILSGNDDLDVEARLHSPPPYVFNTYDRAEDYQTQAIVSFLFYPFHSFTIFLGYLAR